MLRPSGNPVAEKVRVLAGMSLSDAAIERETTSASADDPVLARMQHPDVAKTLDLLDEQDVTLPMRFAATHQIAELMWTHQFTGRAINPEALSGIAPNDDSGLARRSVRTSMR